MKLRDLLYKIEGELDELPADSDQEVLIVTHDGQTLVPVQASSDGNVLIINAELES